MAITEPYETQPVSGPPAGDGQVTAKRHGRGRRWTLVVLAALLATVVVVLGVLAGTYQPIQAGGEDGIHFPGLPTGTGITSVNTFGGDPGELYAPPQLGTFTIVEALNNPGPRAVTIESVSIVGPQGQESGAQGLGPWPLTPAGPVMWINAIGNWPAHGRPVAGLSLAPGQYILVGIPVRLSGTCYNPGGFAEINVFYVKERFLSFTHWVAAPIERPWIFRAPADPGQEPGNNLTCLAK